MADILTHYRENDYLEAKQALGGLPESLWETYSAFANAEGGMILLGVEELPDKSLRAVDLLDPRWLIEDFWAILNDPTRVSINLLKPEDVQVHLVEGKHIIAIHVPRAAPHQRPVYLANDPWRETYRRVGEADKRCSHEEVRQMLDERGS